MGVDNADRYHPTNVEVDRQNGVTLTFEDGMVAEFGLVPLRLGCPCATCRALRDEGLEGWPQPNSPMPLSIREASFAGAWGLNITWNDGHSTGIYPFDALREWAESGAAGDHATIVDASTVTPRATPPVLPPEEPPSVI